MLSTVRSLLTRGSPGVTQIRGTVIVERWWNVPLAKEGKEPYIHPRKHRIYRVLEDTKHSQKQRMELILTQSVPKLGGRGDTVLVEKAKGRNQLLAQGLAVYPSPQNKQMFEEERKLQQQGLLGMKTQTWTGELTVNYLKKSRLEIGVKNDVLWPLSREIVARYLLTNLGLVVPLEALKIPDEPIASYGEYWCDVTVNGIDTVRVPMAVVEYVTNPAVESPAEGSRPPESPAS